jgi:hypothetical protein
MREYLAAGRARQVLMTDNCHDAIIVGLLVFGWLQLKQPGQVLEQAKMVSSGHSRGIRDAGVSPVLFRAASST